MISTAEYQRRYAIGSAATPLGWIFWGALICLVDLTFGQSSRGYGFRFDLVNDVIGTLLIAAGVAWLSRYEAGPSYAIAIGSFLRLASYVAVGEAVLSHFVVPAGHPLGLLKWIAGAVTSGGIVLFCFAMRWLSEAHGLGRSEASWRTTCWMMVWLSIVPYGLLHFLGLLVIIRGGGGINIGVPPLALVIGIAMMIPRVHLLMSLWRMREDVAMRS